MRLPFGAMMLVLGCMYQPSTALAQSHVSPELESRYMSECMKEDTGRYCRCEGDLLIQWTKTVSDFEFMVWLQNQVIDKTREERDAIFERLPEERQTFFKTLLRELGPLVEMCPDFKHR